MRIWLAHPSEPEVGGTTAVPIDVTTHRRRRNGSSRHWCTGKVVFHSGKSCGRWDSRVQSRTESICSMSVVEEASARPELGRCLPNFKGNNGSDRLYAAVPEGQPEVWVVGGPAHNVAGVRSFPECPSLWASR